MTSGASTEVLGFEPSRVTGSFRPSGSKSLAQRALLFAAVARGTTRIQGLSAAEDVLAARALLAALGVELTPEGDAGLSVRGLAPGPSAGLAGGVLAVGESGTLARLATSLAGLASRPGARWTITARGSLLFRKSVPLFKTLSAARVTLARQNLPGTWPVELVACAPPTELRLVAPVSSQEVSGLLAALAAWPTERVLVVESRIPSTPYLEMTRRVLAAFGARIEERGSAPGVWRYHVAGPLLAPGRPFVIEPDASSAAVALAAACLSGGEMLVPGLGPDSAQGDVRIVAHLAAFGCDARSEAEGLAARGFPSRGAELELSGEPDLAPILCAVAAGAALRVGAKSRLSGLGTLPGKESDRLAVLTRALRALGLRVEGGVDWLRIAPGAGVRAEPLLLDPEGDHRMAFAFALLGLLRPGVRVAQPGCVAKSWPDFWRDLEGLGARLGALG